VAASPHNPMKDRLRMETPGNDRYLTRPAHYSHIM